jgi:phenylacetate-CoA ligase
MDAIAAAKKLPRPLQRGLKYFYGAVPICYRQGKVFWDTYKFLEESQLWSREKLEDYQMRQLGKLLAHAYENVPYYRKVFLECGLRPQDIQNFDDFQQVPFLTKDIIRDNLQDLIARNVPKSKLEYVTTGGSTGIPLGFYRERSISTAREWAFMVHQWGRMGFKLGDRCVILRGNVVTSASKGKYWEYEPIHRNLILSSYHMQDETLPKYIAIIRRFKPAFIQAYPSVASIMAKYMKEQNIAPFPGVRALLCGSEPVYHWQRVLMEEVFQCRVFSWYGQSEMVALASECENNTDYHSFPQYGITEVIQGKADKETGEDQLGEIIATGFNNYACPFIRYRTMDLALPRRGSCLCGRNYPLLEKVEGRLQDLIITSDKRFITLTALVFAQHFSAFSKIQKMQLVQEKEGELIVKIIKARQYSNNDESEILSKMEQAVGDGLRIKFDYVAQIPREKNGKYRFLIQKLPINIANPDTIPGLILNAEPVVSQH